jgi:phosphotriesterase-related protein
MATLQTARGPLDTADLGRVLMHEHVFLTELKSAGIDTILDPTAIGLGR